MIAKARRGTDIRGLVYYLAGPGRHEEHDHQRVIAGSADLDTEVGAELDRRATFYLARSIDRSRQLHGLLRTETPTYHLILSNDPGERDLSDEEWAAVARDALTSVGLAETTQWVVIGHGRSANGCGHVHIAVSLVDDRGRNCDPHGDYRQLSRVCARHERRLGLKPVEGRQQRQARPSISRAETEAAVRRGRNEPDRLALARRVRAAATTAATEAEFVSRLRGDGVWVYPRFASGGRNEVTGYSVALPPLDAEQPVRYAGGKLGRDLSLPRLRAGWDDQSSRRAEAVAVWRGNQATGSGPAISDEELHALAARLDPNMLRRIPTGDHSAWRATARDTAGAFAACSRRFEVDQPGPLTAAADWVAYAAQGPTSRTGPDPRYRPMLSTIRRVALVASAGNNSSAAWLVLFAQLQATMRAIAEAQEARREMHSAALTRHATDFAMPAAIAAFGAARTPFERRPRVGKEDQNVDLDEHKDPIEETLAHAGRLGRTTAAAGLAALEVTARRTRNVDEPRRQQKLHEEPEWRRLKEPSRSEAVKGLEQTETRPGESAGEVPEQTSGRVALDAANAERDGPQQETVDKPNGPVDKVAPTSRDDLQSAREMYAATKKRPPRLHGARHRSRRRHRGPDPVPSKDRGQER